MSEEKKDWVVAAEKWRSGQIVQTVELGGISPGYEQAIQILLFEIMARWEGDLWDQDIEHQSYPKEYLEHCDKVVGDLNERLGFSGAQVGAAKTTAYQLMTYGYKYMMDKAPKDRRIQVSKHFPTIADSLKNDTPVATRAEDEVALDCHTVGYDEPS